MYIIVHGQCSTIVHLQSYCIHACILHNFIYHVGGIYSLFDGRFDDILQKTKIKKYEDCFS